MTDSRSTLDDEVDDEPFEDSRETCRFWDSRAGECCPGASLTVGEPCPDCPDAARDEPVRRVRRPAYLDNPKAVGARPSARWGYLPCGCENDGFGSHAAYRR
jgi:hypothetical protein